MWCQVKFARWKHCLTRDKSPRIHQQQTTSRDRESTSPPELRSSPETILDSSFPDGIKVLRECRDATSDICFVHGLTGNRDGTWTADGQSKPWPETLLPLKLSRVRILTYGYDAYVVQKSVASANRLFDHARNLLHDLSANRAEADASSRPIIFVAHSLGGLVCKEAVLLSRDNPEKHLHSIFNCIKGVIFLGTPHKGSWLADWATIPVRTLGIVKSTNKTLLKSLETDDQYLQSVQDRFWSMVREQQKAGRDLEITCFFEELPLLGLGKVVVSRNSATLEGYNAISIHANHRNMVKFSTVDDNGLKRLLGELLRWESQIRLSATSQSTGFEEAQRRKVGIWSFDNLGPGQQYNAPGGVQNINRGISV